MNELFHYMDKEAKYVIKLLGFPPLCLYKAPENLNVHRSGVHLASGTNSGEKSTLFIEQLVDLPLTILLAQNNSGCKEVARGTFQPLDFQIVLQRLATKTSSSGLVTGK